MLLGEIQDVVIVTEPGIVGYRVWDVIEPGYLLSYGLSQVWELEGPAKFICKSLLEVKCKVPGKACSCGMSAYKTEQGLKLAAPRAKAVGKVLLFGTVVVHGAGFRAEYARIVDVTVTKFGAEDWVDAIALRYTVPVMFNDHYWKREIQGPLPVRLFDDRGREKKEGKSPEEKAAWKEFLKEKRMARDGALALGLPPPEPIDLDELNEET